VSNKVPAARALVLQWIDSCLRSNIFPASSFKSNVKDLTPLFVKASEDSTPEVRDAALSCLAVLTSLVGENTLASFTDSLDAIRKEKLQHYISEVPALRGASNKPKDVAASKSRQNESHTASTTGTTKGERNKRMSLQSSRPKLVSKPKRQSVTVASLVLRTLRNFQSRLQLQLRTLPLPRVKNVQQRIHSYLLHTVNSKSHF